MYGVSSFSSSDFPWHIVYHAYERRLRAACVYWIIGSRCLLKRTHKYVLAQSHHITESFDRYCWWRECIKYFKGQKVVSCVCVCAYRSYCILLQYIWYKLQSPECPKWIVFNILLRYMIVCYDYNDGCFITTTYCRKLVKVVQNAFSSYGWYLNYFVYLQSF